MPVQGTAAHTSTGPRPPLADRLTPAQWLALDVAAAVLVALWVVFDLRPRHGFRFEHFARQPDPTRPPPGALEQLTVREREVLALIATGLSNTEIAERLIMSVPTAKTHVSRILAKLGARDRAQLVVLAFQSGLVRPG
jgi:DNA-binding CsgD family transcriptional regulator